MCPRCINCVSRLFCAPSDWRYDDWLYASASNPLSDAAGDLDTACGLGLSMGAFLNSFERVIDSPHRAAVPTLISAASCFEEDAWQAELQYLRAVGKAQISEATDARITQQLAHAKAASALYTAYQRMRLMFGVEGTECPDLSSDEDQFSGYLVISQAFKQCNTMAQVDEL